MTNVPSTARRLDENTTSRLARVSGLASKIPTALRPALEIGECIGEGGMGVVRAAIQVSLERTVAVKTVHPGATAAEAEEARREAWVTGFLEHPGVVPIYDVVEDDAGAPIVVMRRIRGETWHACIADEERARATGARDLLEQNLRIFLRVCEIVEFAHAKGVIHRDIKPANVMIGAYGEVYLLDWGLAVALRGEALRHLPAGRARDTGGTAAYAAPEMFALVDAALSEKTDIYLLGAVLFELAAGHRPHRRVSLAPPLASIDASPPSVPVAVAPRLAEIMRHAMARSPSDRHESVRQLRLDVVAFLRARDSEHLVTTADRALLSLGEECRRGGAPRRIEELYAECRFGFGEALRTWPENPAARDGLVVATTTMIERQLDRDPARALALVEQADGLPADLVARVHAMVAAQAGEQRRLTQLAGQYDGRVGRRARLMVYSGIGATWMLSSVFEVFGPSMTLMRSALEEVLKLVVLGLASILVRELFQTAYSRRMVGSVAVLLGSQVVIHAAAAALGAPFHLVRIVQLGTWAFSAALVAVTLQPRLWPSVVALLGALATSVAFPALLRFSNPIAALCVIVNVLALLTSCVRRSNEGSSCASEFG